MRKLILFTMIVTLTITYFNFSINKESIKLETADQSVKESSTTNNTFNDETTKESEKILEGKNKSDSNITNNPTKNISTSKEVKVPKTETSKSSSVVIEQNKKPDEPPKTNNEVKEDTLIKENKKEESIPIIEEADLKNEVATSDPFYSTHHGKIEFKTKQACNRAGVEVGFLDTVDIKNLGCFEIISKANTVMGYYLKVYCESGNCDRYKSMIDLSKFN